MKYIVVILGVILSISSAQAGLFEYSMGENTHINSKSDESADAVTTLNYNSSQIYREPTYNSRYTNTSQSYYNSTRNNYNSYDFNDSLSGVSREMDHLLSVASSLRVDIYKLKNVSSRSYIYLKNQLEDDLDDVQERINYLSDRKRELLQDTYYYNKDYRYNRNYSRFESQRVRDIYNRYNYSYNDYDYGYYTYDQKNGYYIRRPHWVNPYIEEVRDGRIYIR